MCAPLLRRQRLWLPSRRDPVSVRSSPASSAFGARNETRPGLVVSIVQSLLRNPPGATGCAVPPADGCYRSITTGHVTSPIPFLNHDAAQHPTQALIDSIQSLRFCRLHSQLDTIRHLRPNPPRSKFLWEHFRISNLGACVQERMLLVWCKPSVHTALHRRLHKH